jgi:alpha-tubulin suppressor-like RCC1 family protein
MEGGYVLSWGTGYLGQLGLGDDNSWDSPRIIRQLEPKRLGDVVTRVVCGGSHSGVITRRGAIYMWGLNRNGQTGTGIKAESVLEPRPIDTTDLTRKVPRDLVCGRNHTCLVTTEGRVFIWGAAGFGR